MRDTAGLLWTVLRAGAALCFIGHGAFGIIGKEAWLPFFGVVGIEPALAWRLMPAVGAVDVTMGVLALVSPRPVVFLYMTVWGLWTAALRPLAGEPVWQLVERAGNFGVPLALLALSLRPARWTGWLAPARRGALSPADAQRATRVLAATTVLLLAGHGMIGLAGSALLGGHYAALGLAAAVTPFVGATEVAAALLLAARPSAALAIGIAAWKIATESLFVVSGAPVWEVIERAGSYAAPLALALLLWRGGRARAARRAPMVRAALALAALVGAAPVAAAQSGDSIFPLAATPRPALDVAALRNALRDGGLVLACRHSLTDDGNDSNGERYDDHSRQRNLTDAGRAQARAMGAAIRAAGIPIGDVWASPMWRTTETAQLAFGRARPTTLLRERKDPEGTRALFTDPVPRGTNRVLMTHTGTLIRILSRTRLTPVPEGGCIVLRPDGSRGVTGLGVVKAAEW